MLALLAGEGWEKAGAASEIMRLAFALKNQPWAVAPRPEGLGSIPAPMLCADGKLALGATACLDLLESAYPMPSLFPNGNKGMPLALVAWAEGVRANLASSAASEAAADMVLRQLSDGRDFLQGASPGLADAAAIAALGCLQDTARAERLEREIGGPLPAGALGRWQSRLEALLEKSTEAACPAFPLHVWPTSPHLVRLKNNATLAHRVDRNGATASLLIKQPKGKALPIQIDRTLLEED